MGNSYTELSEQHGFIYVNGMMTDPGYLGGGSAMPSPSMITMLSWENRLSL